MFCVCVNEFIVKKIVNQPRPGNLLQVTDYSGRFVGSCVESCGMPSSHSAIACGLFILMVYDAMLRVHPVYATFDASLVSPSGVTTGTIESRRDDEARRQLPEAVLD